MLRAAPPCRATIPFPAPPGCSLTLLGIPHPVSMGWLFCCPRLWVVGAQPLGVGLAGPMSLHVCPCLPQLSHA